jgi:hypothetical protein
LKTWTTIARHQKLSFYVILCLWICHGL